LLLHLVAYADAAYLITTLPMEDADNGSQDSALLLGRLGQHTCSGDAAAESSEV
jgi:hypothetical protein